MNLQKITFGVFAGSSLITIAAANYVIKAQDKQLSKDRIYMHTLIDVIETFSEHVPDEVQQRVMQEVSFNDLVNRFNEGHAKLFKFGRWRDANGS